jgi:hypothetical protein
VTLSFFKSKISSSPILWEPFKFSQPACPLIVKYENNGKKRTKNPHPFRNSQRRGAFIELHFILYTPDVKVPCLWGLVTVLFIVSRRKSMHDVKEKSQHRAVCVVANCILNS